MRSCPSRASSRGAAAGAGRRSSGSALRPTHISNGDEAEDATSRPSSSETTAKIPDEPDPVGDGALSARVGVCEVDAIMAVHSLLHLYLGAAPAAWHPHVPRRASCGFPPTATSSSAARRRGRPPQAHARIDRDAAVGQARCTGLRSSSATSGRSSPSRASRWTRSTSAAASAAGAAEAAHEPPRLAARDELLGVDVGQRRDPEAGLADQLGEARRPGRTRRAARRPGSWTTPGEQLGAAASIGWTITGAPIRSAAARTASSSRRSSATPPRSVLCAPGRGAS